MSLPGIAKLEINESEEIESETKHKTLLWDFDKGDFLLKDGKTIEAEGKEYLHIWISKALHTVKNTLVYEGVEYGSEHHNLIGTNFKKSFTGEELKRLIKEALLVNSAITNVSKFIFTQEGSIIKLEFEVTSIFGNVDTEVEV